MPFSRWSVKGRLIGIALLRCQLLMDCYSWKLHAPHTSDGGKNIFLSLGVAGVGGYEEVNSGNSDLPDGAKLLIASKWLYGGALHASVEVFLTDSLLLVVRGQGRMLLSGLESFRPNMSID